MTEISVPGRGKDIFVSSSIADRKVIKSKNTGKRYSVVGTLDNEVLLVPLSGNTLKVDRRHMTAENWEVCR